MVATNALEAGEYYKEMFNAKELSKTDLEKSMNEFRIDLDGVEIKILDENAEFGLVAPTKTSPSSMWLNYITDDIYKFE